MKPIVLAIAALSIACSDSTAPTPADSIDDGWSARSAGYSQIRLRMTQRSDGSLVGNWAGDRDGCSVVCRDTGIVINGNRYGDQMTFRLSALNAARSIGITAVMSADSSMTGIALVTDNGQTSQAASITFRRH